MISLLDNEGSGNAIKITIQPLPTTTRFRLLRKTSSTFSGWNDSTAVVAYDTTNISAQFMTFIDIENIVDGTTYYYAVYEYNGTTWSLINIKSILAEHTKDSVNDDPFSLVVNRFEAGINYEVSSGKFKSNTPVRLLLSNADVSNHDLPCISIVMESDSFKSGAVNNLMTPDEYLNPDWKESQGYFSSMVVEVSGYASNIDSRNSIRKSIKRIFQSNLDVFSAIGFIDVSWSVSDKEDFKTYGRDLYMTIGRLSFTYLTEVGKRTSQINSVEVEGSTY